MAKITTPVEGYTGVVVGVSFADGQGETEDAAALAYFARHGYTVEHAEPDDEDEGDEVIDLEAMTVDQLKAFAAEHEYTLGDAAKKAEILEAITSQIPAVEGTPVE